MFDVGFWELSLIFGLGLLVLGPERLPKVAQQVGQWVGNARRMARTLSSQLQEEVNAVDPRRFMDPPPAAKATPAYSRPGVDDLKPRSAEETASGNANTEAEPGKQA